MGSSVQLALETSDLISSVAVVDRSSGRELASLSSRRALASDSEMELSEQVRNCCQQAGVALAAVRAIVVGRGPGSFTGLRVGYAFCKGLALALRVPLFEGDTFGAVARAVVSHLPAAPGLVCVCSDARRGELFAQFVRVARLGEPVLASVDILTPALLASTARQLLEVEAGGLAVLARPSVPDDLLERVKAEVIASKIGPVDFHKSMEQGVASQMLICNSQTAAGEFSLQQLAQLNPQYVRKVAARSLAERGLNYGDL